MLSYYISKKVSFSGSKIYVQAQAFDSLTEYLSNGVGHFIRASGYVSVSPIIANFYMEHFELEALSTFARPPEIWYRYVDDTFTKPHDVHQATYDVGSFTDHFNSRDPYIQFTMETETDVKLPFLNTCVSTSRKAVRQRLPFTGSPPIQIYTLTLVPITIWNTKDR